MSQKAVEIGFIEKLGLKYYAFTVNLLLYVGVYELTKSMEIVLLAIGFIPRLGDLLANDDKEKQENSKEYNQNFYHMLAPVGSVLQSFYIIYYTWINYSNICHSYQSLFSCLLTLGIVGGPTIHACHQLIHRNEIIFRSIGFFGLVPYLITTYPIQHLYFHHKYVGTQKDEVTAPKNMSYYEYCVKTIYSTYRQTFKYSKILFAFCMLLHIGYLFGLFQMALIEFNDNQYLALRKVGFFTLVAIAVQFMMESIEYIEHYGLIYRKDNEQKPVMQICSWNATINPFYNWAIFKFQRHSDHHMNAHKIFSSLEINDKMPKFPFSYTSAIPATWLTIFWYKAVNHLVDRVLNNEKITQEDIRQSKFWILLSGFVTGALFAVNAYFASSLNPIF